MIAKFVDVVTTAGLDLTYDQILDVVWLARTLPRVQWDQLHLLNAEQLPQTKLNVTPPSGTNGKPKGAASPPSPIGRTPPPPVGGETGKRSPPTGPAPGDLYVPAPHGSESGNVRAVPVHVPSAEALPNKPGVNVALRPLKRRYPSSHIRVLDVTATVDQIANGGPSIPILRPAPERWLDAAMVIDDGASMRVWRETVREFGALLARHGSFRDVRAWYVNLDDGELKLYSEASLIKRRLRHPRELIDPTSRRLILVVSDCVAKGWRTGAMFRAMMEWTQRGPVVLVQVLPERLWQATALGDETVNYRSYSAGIPNVRLEAQGSIFDLLRELDGVDGENLDELSLSDLVKAVKRASDEREWKMPLPVINLEGWSIAPWAKLVANVGEATAEGVTIRIPKQTPKREVTVPVARETLAEIDPKVRVARFRATASPGARLLAGYLAVAPLYLPVMRLVQKAMMKSVRQVDLAEVLMSGLVEEDTPENQVESAEDISYRFHPGVRELLLDSVTEGEQRRILREVSRLIEEMTGTTINFRALLVSDQLALETDRNYPVGEKFAEVAQLLAKRLRIADSETSPQTQGNFKGDEGDKSTAPTRISEEQFGNRIPAWVHEAVVRVRLDGIVTSGFSAGPDGQIVVVNPVPKGDVAEVSLWDKTSFRTDVRANDPELHLSLITPPPSSIPRRSLQFAPLDAVAPPEALIASFDGDRWIVKVTTFGPEFMVRSETNLPPGVAGSPVLDVDGRVLGVVRDSNTQLTEFRCIRADAIFQFVKRSNDPTVREQVAVPTKAAVPDLGPRVLVVGTGTYELPVRVQNAALTVGASVATAGGSLVTGGWSGVDYLAAKGFTDTAPRQENKLLHVMEGNGTPQFPKGETIRVGPNGGIAESVKRAELVIMIGGAGGTWNAFREALRTRKMVLPLMNTGTDALHAGLLLEIFGQNVPTSLVRMSFPERLLPASESKLLTSLLRRWSSYNSMGTVENDALLWMTEVIFPMSERYMRKLGRDHEAEIRNMLEQLRSRALPETTQARFVQSFVNDPASEWRCIAYAFLQVRPVIHDPDLLIRSLDIEFGLAKSDQETRPLWRYLSAIRRIVDTPGNKLPASLYQKLQILYRELLSMHEVDPSGECKQILSSIISDPGKRGAGPKTPAESPKRKAPRKTADDEPRPVAKTPPAKKVVKKVSKKASKQAPIKRVTKKTARKAMKKSVKKK